MTPLIFPYPHLESPHAKYLNYLRNIEFDFAYLKYGCFGVLNQTIQQIFRRLF